MHRKLMIGLYAWLTVQFIGFAIIGMFKSPYFSFGPNQGLKFVGIAIDTWPKWFLIIIFRIVGTVAEVGVSDIIGPWITTRLQAENEPELPYKMWQCKLIVQGYYFYWSVQGIFMIFMALTQADIAFVALICSVIVVQVWTLPQWFKNKRYVEKVELKVELSDFDAEKN